MKKSAFADEWQKYLNSDIHVVSDFRFYCFNYAVRPETSFSFNFYGYRSILILVILVRNFQTANVKKKP